MGIRRDERGWAEESCPGSVANCGTGDLADEDRKRLEEVYVQAPGGTKAPRAWSGWNSGKEFEEKRRKLGEEEVGVSRMDQADRFR